MKLFTSAPSSTPGFSSLTLNHVEIHRRVLRRPTLAEFFAILFALALAGISIWLDHTDRTVLYDFDSHMNINQGNYSNYFYPGWIDPIYKLLGLLPFYVSYFIFIVFNLAGVLFSARVFNSPAALVIISYQMLYSIYFGNLTGIVVGGLGIFWLSLAKRNWWLAGIGLLLASAKFQSGMIFAGLLWFYADLPFKDKLKVLIVPAIVFVITLIFSPSWPIELFQRILGAPPNADGSISLWRWVGPWSLLLLVPPILLRMPRHHRLLMLLAAVPLIVPYFQQTDLLGLMVLPIGWIAILSANIAYTYIGLGHLGLQIAFVVPFGLYLFSIVDYISQNQKKSENFTL